MSWPAVRSRQHANAARTCSCVLPQTWVDQLHQNLGWGLAQLQAPAGGSGRRKVPPLGCHWPQAAIHCAALHSWITGECACPAASSCWWKWDKEPCSSGMRVASGCSPLRSPAQTRAGVKLVRGTFLSCLRPVKSRCSVCKRQAQLLPVHKQLALPLKRKAHVRDTQMSLSQAASLIAVQSAQAAGCS